MADEGHAEGERAVPTAGGQRRPRGASAHLANGFTLLRVALVPVIAALLLVEGEAQSVARWWAFGIFVFAALTDSVDGWVARRLIGETRWGQLADPIADKILIIGSLAVLAWLGELPWWAVAVIVVREAAITVQRTRLAGAGYVMPASRFGKAKTISQVVAVVAYLLPLVIEGVALALLLIAVVLTVASGIEYAVRGRRIVRTNQRADGEERFGAR